MGPVGSNVGLGRVLASGVLGDASMGPGMRVLTSYTVVYVLEGAAYYRDANGFESPLGAGHLIFVFPGLAHNYNALPGGHWKQIYFMFDSAVFALWQGCGLLDPARPVHRVGPVDYWFKRFVAVREGTGHWSERRSPVLDMIRLQEVLAEALLAEEAGALSRHDLAWAAEVCTILEKDSSAACSLPAVARRLGISYETFRKRFTQIVGMPPIQYRNRRIIDRACRLMQETTLTNKEIADRLGFYDVFHFSHRFKQITGRSPTEFRRTLPVKLRGR